MINTIHLYIAASLMIAFLMLESCTSGPCYSNNSANCSSDNHPSYTSVRG